jgi:hypothetical protein
MHSPSTATREELIICENCRNNVNCIPRMALLCAAAEVIQSHLRFASEPTDDLQMHGTTHWSALLQ